MLYSQHAPKHISIYSYIPNDNFTTFEKRFVKHLELAAELFSQPVIFNTNCVNMES
jgi:hypothetical protein